MIEHLLLAYIWALGATGLIAFLRNEGLYQNWKWLVLLAWPVFIPFVLILVLLESKTPTERN